MPKVGIQRLGSGSAKKNCAKQPKPSGIFYQQMNSPIGIQGVKHLRISNDLCYSKDSNHGKPHQHNRSETSAYYPRPELLKQEKTNQNSQHNRHSWNSRIQNPQTFYC